MSTSQGLIAAGELFNGERFTSQVLEWKLSDIMNENLLTHRLPVIPSIFDSTDAWCRTFPVFYLEEMRAQLQSMRERAFEDVARCKVKLLQRDGAPGNVYLILEGGIDKSAFESSCIASFGMLVIAQNGKPFLPKDIEPLNLVHLLIKIEFLCDDRDPIWRRVADANLNYSFIFRAVIGEDLSALSPIGSAATDFPLEFIALGEAWISGSRTCDALCASSLYPHDIISDILSGRPCSDLMDGGGGYQDEDDGKADNGTCWVSSVHAGAGASYPLGDEDVDVSELTDPLNDSQRSAVNSVFLSGNGGPPIQLIKGPFGKCATTYYFYYYCCHVLA